MAKKSKPDNPTNGLVQVNAHIDPVLARRLRVRLAVDGLTYKEWLEARIREYTKRLYLPDHMQEAK